MMSQTAAYEKLGFSLERVGNNIRNPYWSAVDFKAKKVCVSIWEDERNGKDYLNTIVDSDVAACNASSTKLQKNLRRIEHLRFAREKCDSKVHVILLDRNSKGGVKDAKPQFGVMWELISLNEITGDFEVRKYNGGGI